MAAPPGNPGGYFRSASPFWMGVIVFCISYFAWAVFLPSTIPYKNLGQLGYFTKYLVDNHHKLLYNGFWLAWGIHVAEALYTVKLCKAQQYKQSWNILAEISRGNAKTKGITDSSVQRRWFIQTFFFGIASLSHLLAYKPPSKKQR